MILPKQGTYERRVLDYLLTIQPRGSRSLKQIKENFGSAISQASLDRIIESEQMDGRIVSFSGGFSLSSEARKAFAWEKTVTPTVPTTRNVFGPELHPSRYIKTQGTRADSDSRVYLSKHV